MIIFIRQKPQTHTQTYNKKSGAYLRVSVYVRAMDNDDIVPSPMREIDEN